MHPVVVAALLELPNAEDAATHISHARALLLVERNEHMHPVVVAALLELPNAEDAATDSLMARRFDSPPSGAGHCCKRGVFWAIAGHTPG